MIPQIALLLSLFVLTRLAAGLMDRRWARTLHSILVAITGLCALLVVADAVRVMATEVGQIITTRASRSDSAAAQASDTVAAPTRPALVVSKSSGGGFTVTYKYAGSTKVADTSLEREWLVINDPSIPVQLPPDAGVRVVYDDGYEWKAHYKLTTRTALQAVDIRFVLFDVWGEHIASLTDNNVVDLPAGAVKDLDSRWRLFSDIDTSRYYVSVAYVARMRLHDGRIVEADTKPILEEIRKFSSKFEPSKLEPSKPGPAGLFAAAKPS